MASRIIASIIRHVAGAAALVALAAPAIAQPVRYDFTALSTGITWSGESFAGSSFSVLNPSGFITSNTIFQVPDLLSCTLVIDPPASGTCRQQEFLVDVSPGWVTVSLGVETALNPGTGIYFYFDDTAFSTPGLHASGLLSNQTGTLQVTVVPEPATAALAALGLVVVGAAGWRRRRQAGAGS